MDIKREVSATLSSQSTKGAKPLVAIVGRPNTGKSALFNRLVAKRLAIIEDLPGTTRDRIYADTTWNGREFALIDTGGLETSPGSDIARLVKDQAQQAIDEADLVLFLVDCREGLTASDLEIAYVLRRTEKPILVVANKADNEERRLSAVQFYELGLGEVVPVSSFHGIATGDLLDMIVQRLPTPSVPEEISEALRVAIIGRPNVGKSSILNAIVGQERAIVHRSPGTTRDALDTAIEFRGQPVLLIDTAGIRRRGHIKPGLEKYGVLRALRALGRCDVAVLVLDAAEGITSQDTHLAGYAVQAIKGLVVVANKWDLVTTDQEAKSASIRQELRFVLYAPMLFVSAKTGLGMESILETALHIGRVRESRVLPERLNEALRRALLAHNPPSHGGRQLKIFGVIQTGTNPPTFVFTVNDRRLLHFSYERYLENQLREHFGFEGTTLKMVFRRKDWGRER